MSEEMRTLGYLCPVCGKTVMLIILMGFELGKSSLDKILHPGEVDSSLLVLVILCASIAVKLYMFTYNHLLGRKLSSPAMTFWQARMPVRLAGLWSGARGMQSSMALRTSSVMRTDRLKASPPCTTRWPTASISFMDGAPVLTRL